MVSYHILRHTIGVKLKRGNSLRKSNGHLDDSVVIAKVVHPIPSRTRPLSPSALMILHLKVWESRSLPSLLNALTLTWIESLNTNDDFFLGWSRPKVRQARTLRLLGFAHGHRS